MKDTIVYRRLDAMRKCVCCGGKNERGLVIKPDDWACIVCVQLASHMGTTNLGSLLVRLTLENLEREPE